MIGAASAEPAASVTVAGRNAAASAAMPGRSPGHHDAADGEQPELVPSPQRQRRRGQTDQQGQRPLDRGGSELPQGLGDDGDDDRTDAVHHPAELRRVAHPDVGPGQTPDDEGGGQDEAGAGEEQPESAAASIPEMNRHLGRVGAGNQVGRGEQIEKVGVGQPPPPLDDLVPHHRDVRGRSAEGGHPQAQKQAGQLADGVRLRHAGILSPTGVRRLVGSGCQGPIWGVSTMRAFTMPSSTRRFRACASSLSPVSRG